MKNKRQPGFKKMTPKFGAYDLEKLVTISKSEKAIKLNDSISLNAL